MATSKSLCEGLNQPLWNNSDDQVDKDKCYLGTDKMYMLRYQTHNDRN